MRIVFFSRSPSLLGRVGIARNVSSRLSTTLTNRFTRYPSYPSFTPYHPLPSYLISRWLWLLHRHFFHPVMVFSHAFNHRRWGSSLLRRLHFHSLGNTLRSNPPPKRSTFFLCNSCIQACRRKENRWPESTRRCWTSPHCQRCAFSSFVIIIFLSYHLFQWVPWK